MTDSLIATHIFVSHSSAEAAFVQRLSADLQKVGVPIWVDHQKLKPGTRNWEKTIRDALKKSRALIYVASPTAAQSNFVQDELSIAEMEGCTLLAAWAVGEDRRWLDCTPLGYGKLQHTDMRGEKYEAGLKDLLDALSNVPVKPLDLTPVPVIAVAPDAPRPLLPPPEPAVTVITATLTPRNPYKALDAFTEADAADFFGRDELVTALRQRLSTYPSFLAVIGASGSGKSSVVMAGLLPALRQDYPEWVIMPPIKPGAHPLDALAIMLQGSYFPQGSINAVRDDLNSPDSRGLIRRASAIPHGNKGRFVLLVDQFEEVFTQSASETEGEQFINMLTSAATDPGSLVTVILTLRADFFDRPLRDSELGKLIQAHSQSVLPLSITDLKQTIEAPAQRSGLSFDEGLVSDLVFEARDQVGSLPLLQYTLEQLYQRREGVRLTRAAYQAIGGVKGALARRAEATYRELPTDDHRKLARSLLLRLIEPGATEQDTTRRRAALSELDLPDPAQQRIMQNCADRLVEGRLLTTNEIAGARTIEVAHEALIREWTRLGEWLREARDDIHLQQIISQDAAAWEQRQRRADDLYRGQKLIDAQYWAARNVPSAAEMAFIDASAAGQVAAEQSERERQARELELAKQAEAAAKRAEAAEKERTVRFRRAARVAAIFAAVATLVAVIAIVGVYSSVIIAFNAGIARDNANKQLGTATVVQGQAVAQAATVGVQATLSELDSQRLQTLVPGIAAVPPTVVPTLALESRLATVTAVAQMYVAATTTPAFTFEDGVEMVLVPAGCFLMGSAFRPEEQPVHQICFSQPFWIDKYEVTYSSYTSLIRSDGYSSPVYWTQGGWEWLQNTTNTDNPASYSESEGTQRPQIGVSWFEANAYCRWRNSRLPTEAEWEYAVRGPDSLVYSWGANWIPDRSVNDKNSNGQSANVGSITGGASWVGAFDMIGNIWEWTQTIYDTVKFSYPYRTDDGRNDDNDSKSFRVVRGASYLDSSSRMRASGRDALATDLQLPNVGFRCARDVD